MTYELPESILKSIEQRGDESAALIKKLGLDKPYMQRQRENAARYGFKQGA